MPVIRCGKQFGTKAVLNHHFCLTTMFIFLPILPYIFNLLSETEYMEEQASIPSIHPCLCYPCLTTPYSVWHPSSFCPLQFLLSLLTPRFTCSIKQCFFIYWVKKNNLHFYCVRGSFSKFNDTPGDGCSSFHFSIHYAAFTYQKMVEFKTFVNWNKAWLWHVAQRTLLQALTEKKLSIITYLHVEPMSIIQTDLQWKLW